jgi:hypothetical protein
MLHAREIVGVAPRARPTILFKQPHPSNPACVSNTLPYKGPAGTTGLKRAAHNIVHSFEGFREGLKN